MLTSRLIDVVLPQGGYVLVLFEAYFDESGALDSKDGVFVVSGYLFRSSFAQAMEGFWAEVLERYEVPYFHMVDCAPGNPPFRHLDSDKRSALVRELIELIKLQSIAGISIITTRERLLGNGGHKELQDAYTYCSFNAVFLLDRWFKKLRLPKKEIAYFFESGHSSKGMSASLLEGLTTKQGASLTFVDKKKVRLVQAADLLAWQTAKWFKDTRLTGRREMRKDLASLLEHRHQFIEVGIGPGGMWSEVMDWPVSLRPEVALAFHQQNPKTNIWFPRDSFALVRCRHLPVWRARCIPKT